jgi:pimeloyl-ACP methyl ester carboxylesterase
VTLVLLHAFPLDERMWEPQRAQFEFVAPRLYGRGRTMDEWADSVAGEVDGELTLVGASMGGYCALAFARRARERMRGLLLVGSRPEADSEERREGRAGTIALIRDEGPDALWRDMRPKLFSDAGRADESLLHRDADALVGAVEAIRDRADSRDVLRSLDVPVAFVVGEHDPFVSADELREYEVHEIAGAAHLPSVERAHEFDAILQEFLTRV